MDELPQDYRGRILFGLEMSGAYPNVQTPHMSATGREAGFSRSFS
jgi:hypothetical protein